MLLESIKDQEQSHLCWAKQNLGQLAVGSEEARSRAGLRPPLKLYVPISGIQLSRRRAVSSPASPNLEAVQEFEKSSSRLTRWLIGLTVALVVLTVVIAAYTVVLAHAAH